MVHALILKDLRSAGFFLWFVMPAFFLYGAQFLAVGQGYYWSSIIVTTFLAVGITAVDWKYEMDGFVCSLPVNRRQVVRGRYLLALAVTFAGYLVATGYAWVVSRLFPVHDQLAPLTSFGGAVTFLVTVILIVSLYYPCYFRWGVGRGFMVFFSIMVAITGLILLIPALAGLLEVGAPGEWTRPGGTLRHLLGLAGPTSEWTWCTAALVGLLLIGVMHLVSLSLALSIRSYRRRDF